MCQTNTWKSLRTTLGVSHINVIGTRSDGKIVQVSERFYVTDNVSKILGKIRFLIETLEEFRNKPITGADFNVPATLTQKRQEKTNG